MEALSSFVLSTISVAIGVVAKSVWDRLLARQEEIARLRRTKRLEILEKQLSEFYWPIYLRLEKDTLLWLKVFDRKNGLAPEIRQRLEMDVILPNHREIINILESKIYLARAKQDLSEQLFQYMRHIAVYQALRDAGITDKDPIDLGEPFPTDLCRLLTAEKDRLQQDYDKLLDLERHS